MAKGQTQHQNTTSVRRDATAVAKPNQDTINKGKQMKEDIDKLLDEIDATLENNAEEFVKNYVQKGGQ